MDSKINELTVSDASKKVYLSVFKRMLKYGFDINKKLKMKDILKLISNVDKPSSKLEFINLIIVLGNPDEKILKELKELRTELNKQRLTKNIETMNKLGEKLMSYDAFITILDKMYEDKNYKDYILNYLMVTYGLRNLDLNLFVCHKKCKEIDPKINYLILNGSKVRYLRNVYKTAKTYGPQEHIIKDEKLIESLKNIQAGYILNQNTTIGNELKKRLILSEAQAFKMIIDHYYDLKDTAKINELSKSRGTSIETIKSFYNVNAKEEIIREI